MPMQRNTLFEGRQFRLVRPPSWQLWLLLAVASAIGVAATIVAAGVLLIAIPISVLAYLGYRVWSSLARTPRRPNGGIVIEGNYEVVRSETEPPRRDGNWRR